MTWQNRFAPLLLAATVGVAGAGVTFASPANPAAPVDLCQPALAQIVGPSEMHGRPAYVACVPVAQHALSGSRVDLRYSRAVSEATGADSVVVCWASRTWAQIAEIARRALGVSMAHTGGFTWDRQQVANLPERLCRYLDEVTYRQVRSVNRSVAWAFKNLTHESIHVAGVVNEAATECYAIQLMAHTITNLGLGHRYAERVARLSWTRYPRMRRIDPIYWTATCHDTGPLDLHPRDDRWPS
jgi:hypothetical protein